MKTKCKICRRTSAVNEKGFCRICSDNLAICYTQKKYLGVNRRTRVRMIKKETLEQVAAWESMDKPVIRLHTAATFSMAI